MSTPTTASRRSAVQAARRARPSEPSMKASSMPGCPFTGRRGVKSDLHGRGIACGRTAQPRIPPERSLVDGVALDDATVRRALSERVPQGRQCGCGVDPTSQRRRHGDDPMCVVHRSPGRDADPFGQPLEPQRRLPDIRDSDRPGNSCTHRDHVRVHKSDPRPGMHIGRRMTLEHGHGFTRRT